MGVIQSTLHAAAKNNNLLTLYRLLMYSDVNLRDSLSKTPLHVAAEANVNHSHYDVAELLLMSAADIDARDRNGFTPVSYFVRTGDAEIIWLLINYRADFTILSRGEQNLLFPAAFYNKNVVVTELLIHFGLNVNHLADDRETPLHWACWSPQININILKCLLRNGANPNAVGRSKFSPLSRSIHRCENSLMQETDALTVEKCVKFMVEHTDLNLIHQDGCGIFSVYLKSKSVNLYLVVLEHIAKLRALGISPNQAILDKISEGKYSNYFTQCEIELLRARETIAEGCPVTYLNLLVDSKRRLQNYAGIGVIREDFEAGTWVSKFPIYGIFMVINMNKGIRRLELFNRASIVLKIYVPLFSTLFDNHSITTDILDCISSKKDLSRLCRLSTLGIGNGIGNS